MDIPYLIVYCTCPAPDVAIHIAKTLVDERLAACVNILPGIMSVYRWQDTVEQEPELLLLIKTHSDVCPALIARLEDIHPYATPEVIAVPIQQGSAAYLAWIDNCIKGKDGP